MSRICYTKGVGIVPDVAIIQPWEKWVERINGFSEKTALKNGIASERRRILRLIGGALVGPEVIAVIGEHLTGQPAGGKQVGAKSYHHQRYTLR
jgi:hypothetical protein